MARNHKNEYIYGNVARKQEFVKVLEEPVRELDHDARKNREKAHHMNLGYVLFLMAALCCTGVVLVHYLQLQSDVTTTAKEVAAMEHRLNDLKLSNAEEQNRIDSSIDMEEIKRIAIGELDMTYAAEGQIQLYTNEGSDYLRRVAGE